MNYFSCFREFRKRILWIEASQLYSKFPLDHLENQLVNLMDWNSKSLAFISKELKLMEQILIWMEMTHLLFNLICYTYWSLLDQEFEYMEILDLGIILLILTQFLRFLLNGWKSFFEKSLLYLNCLMWLLPKYFLNTFRL